VKLGWRIFFIGLASAVFLGIFFAPIPGMDIATRRTLAVFALALILWVSEAVPLYNYISRDRCTSIYLRA